MSGMDAKEERVVIRTPDQRLRVFVSSTLQELAPERIAAREAISALRLAPVMFELGARPHPPRDLYRAYLDQSHIFVGIYWERYGWVAPEMDISGLEDEYRLSGNRPKLIYIKSPAPNREPRLNDLLDRIRNDDHASYKPFSTAEELRRLIGDDLALMLTERFEMTQMPVEAAIRPSGPTHTNNLPVPLTPLVDRERELPTLSDMLRRGEVRLITLVGPGGTGKSRLAIEVARAMVNDFENGVAFVPLASVRDPDLLASAIAQPLGLRDTSDRSLVETLQTYMQDKHMLLVLDNFEQVIAAAPIVSEMLAHCPRLEILVTSRAGLHISWEYEFPVPPLAVPNLKRLPDLEPLTQYASVALFIQRARAVKPDFEVTSANAPAVAEICARLDGLPLAIELAAARIRLFSPQAMLARLVGSGGGQGQSTLRLLTSGAKDLPDRQQTLRNTIEWSYDLLDEGEKQLYRRLAVFAGGCTLEAAETVMAQAQAELPVADTFPDILDGLASLIDESLLQDASQDQPSGEPRYAMLGTIREYAVEQLAASGEEETLRRLHAAYFLALAEKADLQQTERWQSQLETENDNLRAALRWYRDNAAMQEHAEAGLRLAGALSWFWACIGSLSEGLIWLEEMLQRTERLGMSAPRAAGFHGAGILAWHQGDLATAHAYFEQSVAIRRELSNGRALLDSLNWLGRILVEQGAHLQAGTLFEEGRTLSERVRSRWGRAWALHGLATVALRQGDPATAKPLYEQALQIGREIRDSWAEVRALHRLGDVASAQDDYATARRLYEQALDLSQQTEDKRDYLRRTHAVALAVYRVGDTEWSGTLFRESLALAREMADRQEIAWSLNYMADVERCEGDDARAESLYNESLAIFRDMAHKQGLASVLHNLGYLALHKGDTHQAEAHFRESLNLFREVGNRWKLGDALAAFAALAATHKQAERAAQLFGAAAALHNQVDLSGLLRDPANWSEWERNVALAREQIDEEAWTMAWATGYTMTLEDAAALALDTT